MEKALIFDMDGVIVDSEPVHNKATTIILEKIGVDPMQHPFEEYVGIAYPDIFASVIKEFDLDTTVDDIMEMHKKNIIDIFKDEILIPIEGTIKLIQEAKKAGCPIAVASSSSREMIELVLGKLDIRAYIDVIVSGEELPKGKPDPAIFLKASELLGIAPDHCTVIEDSPHGVAAAKTAGMTCIGYQNPNSGNQNLEGANLIVHDMMDVTLTQIIGG